MMSKIIVLNEPCYRTGGVESIYQFVDAINAAGGDGYVYFKSPYNGDPIPDEYKKYNVKVISNLEDVGDNLIVVPEVWTGELSNIKNAKKAVWWLSVDNNNKSFTDFSNADILHLYQSEYAKDFLEKNGVANMLPVHDYIVVLDFKPTTKQNIICYNPLKGERATNYVRSKCGSLTFKPLINMSKEEIVQSLINSKIYIDFGHHPGRDRIPREAAHYNNIVITSCLGSAKFYEDVPIPDRYKLRELTPSIEATLTEVLQNYDTLISDFTNYKNTISNQKAIQLEEAKQLLEYLRVKK